MLSLKNILILKKVNFFKDLAQNLLLFALFNLQAYFELFFDFFVHFWTQYQLRDWLRGLQ